MIPRDVFTFMQFFFIRILFLVYLLVKPSKNEWMHRPLLEADQYYVICLVKHARVRIHGVGFFILDILILLLSRQGPEYYPI